MPFRHVAAHHKVLLNKKNNVFLHTLTEKKYTLLIKTELQIKTSDFSRFPHTNIYFELGRVMFFLFFHKAPLNFRIVPFVKSLCRNLISHKIKTHYLGQLLKLRHKI